MIPRAHAEGNPLLCHPAPWVTPPGGEVQHVNEALIMPANVFSGEGYRIDVATVIGLTAMGRAAEAEEALRIRIGALAQVLDRADAGARTDGRLRIDRRPSGKRLSAPGADFVR